MSPIAVLPADISSPCIPVIRGTEALRSAELTRQIVAQFSLESAPRYRPRDYDGDGKRETFCNVFINDATDALGCPVPRRLDRTWYSANAQHEWLAKYGEANGWRVVDRTWIHPLVEGGRPIVATWLNDSMGPGHIALCVAHKDGRDGIYVAQAGIVCHSCLPYGAAFGRREAKFYVHN